MIKKNVIISFMIIPLIFFSCASASVSSEEIFSDEQAVIFVEMKDSSNHIDTTISYPEFKDEEFLNEAISNYIGQRWNAIKDVSDKVYSETQKNCEYIVETSVTQSGDIYSVLINTYEYLGGANGETVLYSLNFDKSTNEFIDIEKASGYTKKELSEFSQKVLIEELMAKVTDEIPSKTVEELKEMIVEGCKESDKTYTVFTLDNSLLTIYFAEGSVGPYSEGAKKVTLSISN